ncbi:hypothetical protein CJJ23_01890 [Mycoplasmopsis agassizii]|uniref:Uncharacterized protein n=1 Tax=Mycoplasmopsis agassizii TaxID=33922 RepID=A0A269TJ55_9BACT|nr:hypothetical protein [Mycoplasmopsis agassizii]PAK21522.1 hypothetical protein CJJ23_01890 [Mycoplasmopsis agassizii]
MKTNQYKKLKTLAWWYLSMQIVHVIFIIIIAALVIDWAVQTINGTETVISDTRSALLTGAKFLVPLAIIIISFIIFIILAIVLYVKLGNFSFKGSFDTARTMVLISIFFAHIILASIAVANIYIGIKEYIEDSEPEDYIEKVREIKSKQ